MKRTVMLVMLGWAPSVLLGTAGAGACPCHVDADCDDGVDCNGVETCGYDSECRPGAGLCGPMTGLFGTKVTASSTYSQAHLASNVIDGVDQTDSSWCSARNDPAPAIAIMWALGIEIHEIRVLTSWSPSYDFLTGRFRLIDAAGATLFDSGSVAFAGGEITVPVTPAAAGVRRLEMIGETWRSSDPCLSEVEVDGALPCATDADCAFVSPCIGVGNCLPTGNCSAMAPRCRNLAVSHAGVTASTWDPPYTPESAVDGVDLASSSWCALSDDPVPTFTLTLPNEHPVDMVRITDPWSGGGGRPAVPDDGICRGTCHHRALRCRALDHRTATGAVPDGLWRSRLRASQPHRPPGPQAVQNPGHRPGRRQAARLRNRQAARAVRWRRCPGHPHGHTDDDARLRQPGAGARRGDDDRDRGASEAADMGYRRAIAIRSVLGEQHRDLALAREEYSAFLRDQDRPARAGAPAGPGVR